MKQRVFKIIGALALCLALVAPALAGGVSRNVHNGMPLYNSDQALEALRLGEVDKSPEELFFLCKNADEVWTTAYGELRANLADLRLGAEVEYSYSNFCMTYTKMLQESGPEEMRGLSWMLASVMAPDIGSGPYNGRDWISSGSNGQISLIEAVWGGALGTALMNQYGADLGVFIAAWNNMAQHHQGRPEPYRTFLQAIIEGDAAAARSTARSAIPAAEDGIRTLYEVAYEQVPVVE